MNTIPSESNDLKARLLLKEVERRRHLLQTANKRPSQFLQLGACLLAWIFLHIYHEPLGPPWMVLMVPVVVLAGLIETHTRITNQRIDALIKLLDEDKLSHINASNEPVQTTRDDAGGRG